MSKVFTTEEVVMAAGIGLVTGLLLSALLICVINSVPWEPPLCGPYAPPSYASAGVPLKEVATTLQNYNATGWKNLEVAQGYGNRYRVAGTCPLSIAHDSQP